MNKLPEGSMHLDDVVPIEDFSNETLIALAQRLETSTTFQQLILREVEMDEVWRRVDTVIKAERERADTPEALAAVKALVRVHELVFEAHDLAAEGEPLEAAKRLRDAMMLTPGG